MRVSRNAGAIRHTSSRSTGIPSDTRNSRRVLDRFQSGGCNVTGAIICCQSAVLDIRLVFKLTTIRAFYQILRHSRLALPPPCLFRLY